MTDVKQSKGSRRDQSRAFDEALGAKIRTLRVGADLSQADLGARLGISCQQIHKHETGKDRCSVFTLAQIAAALGTPVAMFLEDTPLPSGNIPSVRGAMKAVSALQGIEHPALRRRLLDLIAELTKPGTSRAKQP